MSEIGELRDRLRKLEFRFVLLAAVGTAVAVVVSVFTGWTLTDIPRKIKFQVESQIKTNVTVEVANKVINLREKAEASKDRITVLEEQAEKGVADITKLLATARGRSVPGFLSIPATAIRKNGLSFAFDRTPLDNILGRKDWNEETFLIIALHNNSETKLGVARFYCEEEAEGRWETQPHENDWEEGDKFILLKEFEMSSEP